MSKLLVIIAGPTAIGKTQLTVELAKHFNTEILSCDSRQFYKELSIGTAKPSLEEMQGVKHHFIDSLSIHQKYSVADYENEALAILEHLFKTKDLVFMTGGSGLFIQAIAEGLHPIPDIPIEIREKYNKLLSQEGLEALKLLLKERDPITFGSMDNNNPRRLIRALEVLEHTQKPIRTFFDIPKAERPFNILTIVLTLDRPLLYAKINKRVDQMMEMGLVNEVEGLVNYQHLTPLKTVGYSEIFNYLNGSIPLEKAIDLVKKNSRNYAKRQITWFQNHSHNLQINMEDYRKAYEEILSRLEKSA